MRIVVIKPEKLYKYVFPNEDISSFWIKDLDETGNNRNLILIDKNDDGKWFFISNNTCYVDDNGAKLKKIEVKENIFYSIKIIDLNNNISTALIFIEKDDFFSEYRINENKEYTIGKGNDCSIILSNEYVNELHARIIKSNEGIKVVADDNKYGIYINDIKYSNRFIENGDVLFILGYKFIFLKDYLLICDYNDSLRINTSDITKDEIPSYSDNLEETEENDDAFLYNENDYYSRQPRFVTSLTDDVLNIDSPPAKNEADDTPLLYTILPMITMSLSSALTVTTSLSNLSSGKTTLSAALPSLIVAGAMIVSTILMPTLTRNYNKKKLAKKEEERQKKYSDYLTEKKNKIISSRNNQYQILIDNYPEPHNLQNIILNKKRELWERKIDSDDFLNVRLGLGTIPMKLQLQYSKEDFSMVEDNLKDQLTNLTESVKDIPNCPVTIDLTARNKLVIIGESRYKESLLKSVLLQIATYHPYNEVKFVFMINDTSSDIWNDVKILPHCWSNSRDIRFYANDYDEMTKISFYLEQAFVSRKYVDDGNERKESSISFRDVLPYYLIIVDNIKKNKNVEIINKVLHEEGNLGFGIIVLNDGIGNLPNEIKDFISASGSTSAIIKDDLNKNNQQVFSMDSTENINFALMCEKLSNIPIKSSSMIGELKKSVGFLEMFNVGRVEQLNIYNRWTKNNPVNSLSVPIGLKANGELFNIDLHEKFHGPHGLIAGTTGSGKSEWIITFILSMCLNFSPLEVSFVLIDYKGGGLTGAFENKLTGVKLPHLAGTITNLDKAEINRSLSSIRSELKRRQELFNKAKFELNESTLDIYKYQQFYRDGQIKEPISHLFIISDEFAELKSQQPDFMDELISTARIGRSLGVHLILATQKPNGIVDDQIWSNSRFKVCLKVQDRADSMDVIKCPDAVNLKNAGRFYLQVGYNEYFDMGQAAYAGVKYIPKDTVAKVVNRDITILDNIGDAVRSFETVHRAEATDSHGEELPNVLNYIYESAKNRNMSAKQLWLDKIPNEIFVNDLMKKYSFATNHWDIKAIIGEYDDPSNQRQDLLTLSFNGEGNTIVYGTSGKEIFLASIMYSLIIRHAPEEVNIYIIDFGSEMFGPFKKAPQIGDVVFLNEDEKLKNLFSSIFRELEKRKKLFANYSGSYNLYIKNSGQKLPQIIIIINNYEVFNETYEDYVDYVSQLSRDGEKYGISFIMSASGVNAVRSRISQNFHNMFCLQLNDPSDYSSVLGQTRGMVPSNAEGRGLFKIEKDIFEFQTAYPCKWDKISSFISAVCEQINQRVRSSASTIAVLPDHVRFENVSQYVYSLRNVPIGIIKDTLEVCRFDYEKNPISLVSGQDISYTVKFISSLFENISKINSYDTYFIDCDSLCDRYVKGDNYLTDGNKAFDIIKASSEKPRVFIINGLDIFFNYIGDANKKQVKEVFNNLKNSKDRFIICDSIDKIKTIEYDPYYKTCVQANNAIWYGSGISDQFTIKCSTFSKITRSVLPDEFGFLVVRGLAVYVKLLDYYSRN